MSSVVDFVIGNRKVSNNARNLLKDYLFAHSFPKDLNLLRLEEAKAKLSERQLEIVDYIVKNTKKGILISRKKIIKETHCQRTYLYELINKRFSSIVGDYSFVCYAQIFLQYRKGRQHFKFPPPLNESFRPYENYFRGSRRGEKLNVYKLIKNPNYPLHFAYARVLDEDKEPMFKRVFPSPNEITLFHAYDILLKSS